MTDTERFFDRLLNDAASGHRTPAECLSVCKRSHPELVEPLRLAMALRSLSPDAAELDAARTNIRHTLDTLLDQEAVARTPVPGVASRNVHPWRWSNRRWLPLALCAAILLAVFVGNWVLAALSAEALPGSPLYAIKRAEEDIQLRLAWSSQARGDVLSHIAIHRLEEARAEASRGNTSQALMLMKESNTATNQLVHLIVALHRQHQDVDSLKNALARTLHAEYDALAQARKQGQAALVQALAANVTEQQQTLSASNIAVPQLATPVPGLPPAATLPAHATPPADPARSTPTPGPKPRHTPTATPSHPTPPPHGAPGSPTPSSQDNGGSSNSSIKNASQIDRGGK